LAEQPLTRHRERPDDQDPDQPHHDCHKDRYYPDQGLAGDHGIAQGVMVEDCQGYTPPGEHGVHGSSQHPGAEQVPDFSLFMGAFFWGEEAGDAGEVDPAEGDRQDSSPADAGEAQITEQVGEGIIGSGVVEGFEGDQGSDDEGAEQQAAADAEAVKDLC